MRSLRVLSMAVALAAVAVVVLPGPAAAGTRASPARPQVHGQDIWFPGRCDGLHLVFQGPKRVRWTVGGWRTGCASFPRHVFGVATTTDGTFGVDHGREYVFFLTGDEDEWDVNMFVIRENHTWTLNPAYGTPVSGRWLPGTSKGFPVPVSGPPGGRPAAERPARTMDIYDGWLDDLWLDVGSDRFIGCEAYFGESYGSGVGVERRLKGEARTYIAGYALLDRDDNRWIIHVDVFFPDFTWTGFEFFSHAVYATGGWHSG